MTRNPVPPDGRAIAPGSGARGSQQRPQPTCPLAYRLYPGAADGSAAAAARRDHRRRHRRPGCPVSLVAWGWPAPASPAASLALLTPLPLISRIRF
jgi:hypothetical protein